MKRTILCILWIKSADIIGYEKRAHATNCIHCCDSSLYCSIISINLKYDSVWERINHTNEYPRIAILLLGQLDAYSAMYCCKSKLPLYAANCLSESPCWYGKPSDVEPGICSRTTLCMLSRTLRSSPVPSPRRRSRWTPEAQLVGSTVWAMPETTKVAKARNQRVKDVIVMLWYRWMADNFWAVLLISKRHKNRSGAERNSTEDNKA